MKRARALFAIFFFSITGLVVVQGPGLMFAPLLEEFSDEDTRPFNPTLLLSAPTLFMGIGAFLWIPLSLAIGRRPVFLLGTMIMLLATLWAGIAGNFYQLLIAVCLQGLAEGVNTSTGLLMAIDLTFIHQRPQIIAMLWCLIGFVGGCIYSLVPQITNTSTSWRSFYLLWIFPSAISVTLAFFLFPETYFIRPAVAFDGRILAQSATEKVQIYQDWEEVPGGKSLPDIPYSSPWVRDLQFWGTTRGGWKAMWACYPQILGCFVNPLIFWVALLNAIVFGSMLSIGETYNFALTGPPYFLDIRYTALVNAAGAIGSLIAWPVSGKMIAWVSRRLAMSNAGVRDAEHYLPAFILPIIAGTTSVIIYGLAVQHKWHFMFIYVSYGLNTFTFSSLATANTLWVTEAFPRWAAPALVVLSGVSYMASFGISFSIQPWVASQGIANTNIEIGSMIAVVGLVLIPIAFWGKKLRDRKSVV